jgi:hypothetical protein
VGRRRLWGISHDLILSLALSASPSSTCSQQIFPGCQAFYSHRLCASPQAMGFALCRESRATNHHTLCCLSFHPLNLLSGSMSDFLLLHGSLLWLCTTLTLLQDVPILSEPILFLRFQVSQVVLSQNLLSCKHLLPAGNS